MADDLPALPVLPDVYDALLSAYPDVWYLALPAGEADTVHWRYQRAAKAYLDAGMEPGARGSTYAAAREAYEQARREAASALARTSQTAVQLNARLATARSRR